MAERIQRKRTKGWKMPKGAVYVGRPTVFGNPYLVNPGGFTREEAVELFRKFMQKTGEGFTRGRIPELRGKDLACWCPLVDKDGNPVPCHADVLLEIANKEIADDRP